MSPKSSPESPPPLGPATPYDPNDPFYNSDNEGEHELEENPAIIAQQMMKPEDLLYDNYKLDLDGRQESAVMRFAKCNNYGILLIHKVGTGKTITSLLIALNRLRKQPKPNKANQFEIIIVAPKGIYNNFISDLEKTILFFDDNKRQKPIDADPQLRVYNFFDISFRLVDYDYNTLIDDVNKRQCISFQDKIVIFDEAHRLLSYDIFNSIEASSAMKKHQLIEDNYFKEKVYEAIMTITMSGTPMQTDGADFCKFGNFLTKSNQFTTQVYARRTLSTVAAYYLIRNLPHMLNMANKLSGITGTVVSWIAPQFGVFSFLLAHCIITGTAAFVGTRGAQHIISRLSSEQEDAQEGGQVKTGQVQTGQVQTGQVQTGQVQTGGGGSAASLQGLMSYIESCKRSLGIVNDFGKTYVERPADEIYSDFSLRNTTLLEALTEHTYNMKKLAYDMSTFISIYDYELQTSLNLMCYVDKPLGTVNNYDDSVRVAKRFQELKYAGANNIVAGNINPQSCNKDTYESHVLQMKSLITEETARKILAYCRLHYIIDQAHNIISNLMSVERVSIENDDSHYSIPHSSYNVYNVPAPMQTQINEFMKANKEPTIIFGYGGISSNTRLAIVAKLNNIIDLLGARAEQLSVPEFARPYDDMHKTTKQSMEQLYYEQTPDLQKRIFEIFLRNDELNYIDTRFPQKMVQVCSKQFSGFQMELQYNYLLDALDDETKSIFHFNKFKKIEISPTAKIATFKSDCKFFSNCSADVFNYSTHFEMSTPDRRYDKYGYKPRKSGVDATKTGVFECEKFEDVLSKILAINSGAIPFNCDKQKNKYEKHLQNEIALDADKKTPEQHYHHPHGIHRKVADGKTMLDEKTDGTYLPLVYSYNEDFGLALFACYLQSKGLNYVLIHNLQKGVGQHEIVDESGVGKTVDLLEYNKHLGLNTAYTFPNQSQNPICVLIDPTMTEGLNATYNPAIFLLEACNTYGDSEQVYGRVLRKYKTYYDAPKFKYIYQYCTTIPEFGMKEKLRARDDVVAQQVQLNNYWSYSSYEYKQIAKTFRYISPDSACLAKINREEKNLRNFEQQVRHGINYSDLNTQCNGENGTYVDEYRYNLNLTDDPNEDLWVAFESREHFDEFKRLQETANVPNGWLASIKYSVSDFFNRATGVSNSYTRKMYTFEQAHAAELKRKDASILKQRELISILYNMKRQDIKSEEVFDKFVDRLFAYSLEELERILYNKRTSEEPEKRGLFGQVKSIFGFGGKNRTQTRKRAKRKSL
jgi:hypothetical protein